MPVNLPSSLLSALELAKQGHRCQRRKHGSPYIEHPLSTALVLAGWGYVDEELLVAAVLHDVIEDCGVEPARLTHCYGERVSSVVQLPQDRSRPTKSTTQLTSGQSSVTGGLA
jgi:(p)ppGpp synthase/HD superfamily hydrolase